MTSPAGAASLGGTRSSCTTRHRVARWNAELREFELQCPSCRAQSKQSYWPLTLEFWDAKGVSKCRACWLEYGRKKAAQRRLDDKKRAHDRTKTAEWRARHPGYGTITVRAWRAANAERDRAVTNARNARKRAA